MCHAPPCVGGLPRPARPIRLLAVPVVQARAGGAGSLLAERVKRVVDVKMLEEFGSPEAFWIIEVEDFPLVVTMDSHGGSLHEIVAQQSQDRAKALMA